MTDHPSTISQQPISSDLTMPQQYEQLAKLIADYAARYAQLGEGEEKNKVARRLTYLTKELKRIEIILLAQSSN
jgi:hypothetical protein